MSIRLLIGSAVVILIIALAIVFVAANSRANANVTVVDKEYDRATSKFEYKCAGNKRTCKAKDKKRVVVEKPECWELDLSNDTEVCVSEETYNKYNKGDIYP